jgi:uncharacterized membrane protein
VGFVVRAVAAEDRMLAAVPPGTMVRAETRIGAYIHEGEPLMTLWPVPADARTMQQDVDFAIRQLVDIGLRALSSAINDPTTAVEVTLRIGGLLRRPLVVDLPAPVLDGPGGRTLVRPWSLSHEDYVAHSVDQLRQASSAQPQVVTALLRVLRMLTTHVQDAGRPEHVPALRRQVDLLLAAAEQQPGRRPEDADPLRAVSADATDPADRGHR